MSRAVLLAFLVLASPALADLLPGRGVGPCRLGQDPDSLESAWGPPRRQTAESKDERGIPDIYYEYPEKGVWLLVRNYRVIKIGIEGGRWESSDGTRLWMPVREVLWLYGQGNVRRPEDEASAAVRYFIDYPHRGISFLVRKQSEKVEAIHLYPAR